MGITDANRPPGRMTHVTCACGCKLTIYRAGDAWQLYRFAGVGILGERLPEKTCPSCGQDFSMLSVDELTDRFWPGGLAG